MTDQHPHDPEQEEPALAPELTRLHERLLREGERWQNGESSTARLERHVQSLARSGAANQQNAATMLAERESARPLPSLDEAPVTRRDRSRWRGLLPVAAAVLLVALASSIFAVLGAHHAGLGQVTTHRATATPGISRVTAVRPQDTQLPLPAYAYLADLSFSSAHDGWAVGGLDGPASAGRHTVLIHYHDGVWTASNDIIPNAYLSSVSMVSADDGWAVGASDSTQPGNTNGVAFLLHYTGGRWQRLDLPTLTHMVPESLLTIQMASSGFGYLSGTAVAPEPGSNVPTTHLLILVYQSGTWTPIPNTFAYGNGAVMVSPSEGWLTTNDNRQSSAFYHYLNGVWTKTATYPGLLYTMQVVSARDIWAAGVTCATRAQCQPAVYHFDGVSWAPVTMPVVTGLDWTNLGWVALAADTAGDVWYSVLDSGFTHPRQYAFFTYAHGSWASIDLPVSDYGVLALTTDGNGGAWAIVHSSAPQLRVTVAYTSGGAWSIYGHS